MYGFSKKNYPSLTTKYFILSRALIQFYKIQKMYKCILLKTIALNSLRSAPSRTENNAPSRSFLMTDVAYSIPHYEIQPQNSYLYEISAHT